MMNPCTKPRPKRLSPAVFLISLLSACMVVTACYYSTSQGSRAGDIRNIVIPLFDNTTVETGIQESLTDTVIERFLTNGEFRIVDLRQADAAIIGVITALQEESVAFSEGTLASGSPPVDRRGRPFRNRGQEGSDLGGKAAAYLR